MDYVANNIKDDIYSEWKKTPLMITKNYLLYLIDFDGQ